MSEKKERISMKTHYAVHTFSLSLSSLPPTYNMEKEEERIRSTRFLCHLVLPTNLIELLVFERGV